MSSHLNSSIYNFLLTKSLHCSEVQCSVVQWSEVQCSTTQCSAMQCTQFSAVQCSSQTMCSQVQWSFKVYNSSKYLSQPLPTLKFRVQAQPGFEFSAARIWVCCCMGLSFPVLLWLYCISLLQHRPLILTAPAPSSSKPGSSKIKPCSSYLKCLRAGTVKIYLYTDTLKISVVMCAIGISITHPGSRWLFSCATLLYYILLYFTLFYHNVRYLLCQMF